MTYRLDRGSRALEVVLDERLRAIEAAGASSLTTTLDRGRAIPLGSRGWILRFRSWGSGRLGRVVWRRVREPWQGSVVALWSRVPEVIQVLLHVVGALIEIKTEVHLLLNLDLGGLLSNMFSNSP